MHTLDKIFYVFVFNFYFMVLIFVTNIIFQNNIIASVRAIGIQCKVDYTITIPNSKGKNINAN